MLTQNFEATFGDVRSLIAQGGGSYGDRRFQALLLLIWPWRSDPRLEDILLPYITPLVKDWSFNYLPDPFIGEDHNREVWGEQVFEELVELRRKFWRGEPDPLWPLFQGTTLRFTPRSPYTPGSENYYPGDQHDPQGIHFPPNNALKVIDIDLNDVDTTALQALFSGPVLHELFFVLIKNYSRREEARAGVIALLENPSLTKLARLELYDVPMGDEGVGAIARCPRLKHLSYLGLGGSEYEAGCGVTDEGIKLLAASPVFAQLEGLDLSWNEALTDACVPYITAVQGARMEQIYTEVTGISEDGEAALCMWMYPEDEQE